MCQQKTCVPVIVIFATHGVIWKGATIMPKDEALNDPQGDFQDLLVTAAYDYIVEHGLPTSSEAMAWIANPNYEDIIEKWMSTSGGFTPDDWLRMIDNVMDVSITKSGKGVDIAIYFDFDDGTGDYNGERTASSRF